MSGFRAIAAVIVLSAGWSAAADPMPEVVLTVTASATETTLPKGGGNAEPVSLTFKFKNVSDKEQKLDITRIERHLLSLKVTGPDGKPVLATYKRTGPPGSEALSPTQVKDLAAGDAWETTKAVPGVWSKPFSSEAAFVFDKPGTYTITAVYNGARADKDAWRGTTTSKAIEIKVKEASKE